jgi:hypothetical protein
MAAGLGMTPPAGAGAAIGHAPAITGVSTTEAVVQIKNLTSAPVTFSFRWTESLPWSTTTLAPGSSKIFWADNVAGLQALVRFDRSAIPGVQEKAMSLAFATYAGGGTPPASAAKAYAFQTVPGGIDLTDKVSTRAVVGFKNTSNTTVLLQFRWSNSANWSPVIKMAPGKVQYFWTSTLNTSQPEVRYDRSPRPGWQLQTYGLGFNTYSGTGNPPFSSARVYTFRSTTGGVGLFS